MTTIPTATSHRPYLADALKTHRLYRRIFGDLPFVAAAVADGDRARARVVSGIFGDYVAQFTHRAEVAERMLWPVLAIRAGSTDDVSARIREKRERMLSTMRGLRPVLSEWQRTGDVGVRAQVAGTFSQLHTAMVDVLDDEAAHLLPIIEEHFDAAEWRRLCRATRASSTRRGFVVQMGWVMDGLDAAERADFLHSLTATQRTMWRCGGRRGWQRQRDRLYDL